MVTKNRPAILNEIINSARTQKALKKPLKAIFDLDSTLFDVSPRITQILHEFAADPTMIQRFPEEVKILAKVQPHSKDYGVRRTLERYNFTPPSQEFGETLIEYWKTRFFSDHYLKYDVPYVGATDYVRSLYDAGADILYLTGRDIPRMHKGTIDALKTHAFPLDPDHANLILKPKTELRDTEFKKDFFMQMDRSESPVWFFENEPANIHLVSEHCPHIHIVFVDTVHSGAAPLPGDEIPRVEGFYF